MNGGPLFPDHVIMPEVMWRELRSDLQRAQSNYSFEAKVHRDAERYRWIREHGAWETEAFLNGLSAEEYDREIDKRMEIDP